MKTTGIMTTVLTEGMLKVHLNGEFFFPNNFLKNGKCVLKIGQLFEFKKKKKKKNLFLRRKNEQKKQKNWPNFRKFFQKKNNIVPKQ